MGRNYRALDKPTEAIANFRKGLENAPDDPFLRFELGKTLFQVGDQELGLRELRRAVELKPDMPDAYQQLGIGLYLRRAYEDAIENLKKAIDLGNNSALSYYIIGRSYLNLEEVDCENAVPWLKKALETDVEMIPADDARAGIERCGETAP
jgi:tetratricopeptide (TPR) repeat protein